LCCISCSRIDYLSILERISIEITDHRPYDSRTIDYRCWKSDATIDLDRYIKSLNPDVVMFDRFVMEEHYGWRIVEHCPQAIRILDTEDLHFLRKARETSIKKHGDLSQTDLFTEAAKRELASIMRCDLSLIISEFEVALLTGLRI